MAATRDDSLDSRPGAVAGKGRRVLSRLPRGRRLRDQPGHLEGIRQRALVRGVHPGGGGVDADPEAETASPPRQVQGLDRRVLLLTGGFGITELRVELVFHCQPQAAYFDIVCV